MSDYWRKRKQVGLVKSHFFFFNIVGEKQGEAGSPNHLCWVFSCDRQNRPSRGGLSAEACRGRPSMAPLFGKDGLF